MTMLVDRLEYDIRVSILPSTYGEKVVMRLTSSTALTRSKSELGLRDWELKRFDHMLGNPNGILLVTGPTGSGKSTTLYTALSELNSEEVNIITRRGPGRGEHTRHQPGAGQSEGQPDLCLRAPLHPPPGPGHYHDR